jgi:hypothetical protein
MQLLLLLKITFKLQLFFSLVNSVFNVVGALCKRRGILRKKWTALVVEALQNNEILLVVA